MHRDLLIVGAAVVALTVAACDRQTADAPPERETMPDAHAVATLTTPANESAAPDFVIEASKNNLMEVAASKLAVEKAQSDDVKAFAKKMISTHEQAAKALGVAAAVAGQTLVISNTLAEDEQKKIEDLAATSAEDFDRAYMDLQVSLHQDALNLMQRYAMDGDREKLKAFAADTGAAIQKQYDKAVALRDSLN